MDIINVLVLMLIFILWAVFCFLVGWCLSRKVIDRADKMAEMLADLTPKNKHSRARTTKTNFADLLDPVTPFDQHMSATLEAEMMSRKRRGLDG